MGLLSRASTLDETEIKQGLAFSDFILKYSLKSSAMLEQNDMYYIISQSIDFDAYSIISSNSTCDFWNGICKENNKIYKFSGNDVSPLLQLFSSKMKEEIKEVYIYRNSDSKILLSLNEISESAAQDFENITSDNHSINIFSLNPQIKENTAVIKLMIDFSEAIESFLQSELKTNDSIFEKAKLAIFNEIYNRFVCFYNLPDATVKADKLLIKTVFITGKAYSVELITNHFIFNLRDLLGNNAELIRVDFCGAATSCEQIQNFLQAE